MSKKIEIQKGSLEGNPPTSKQMTHSEKQRERAAELHFLRYGQTLDLHEPKTRRK